MKHAFITGASGGIGSACARALAENGFAVTLCFNNGEEAAKKLNDELSTITDTCLVKADVSDPEQVNKAFENAAEKLGDVSVLVNCAGVSLQKLFTDCTAEDYRKVMGINADGVFNCCKCAVPFMVRQKQGKIINISSMWGVCGASCEVIYSASKAAVIGLTKALARELAPSNIQVNCITPGVIDTKMNACFTGDELEALREECPMGRFGTPEEVAAAVAFLAGGSSDYITAQVLGVDGAFI